jgi:predicted type IV restriction endonuclease
MASVPAKVAARLREGLKKFQPILNNAKARDLNESDTSVIVTDLLHDVFGYDKYSEITREHAIRGTFCDLAIKLDNALALLIEVKAIGSELKDAHVKQAVDYAANQGCEWVILTNGSVWRTYKVQFLKPITQDMVVEFDLCQLSGRNESHLEMLGLIAKEGWQKANIGEYHIQRQALSRFSIAALILSDAVSDVLRRELRRLSKGIRVEEAELQKVLREEVLKRDAIEGEKADAARRMVSRSASRSLKSKGQPEAPEVAVAGPPVV